MGQLMCAMMSKESNQVRLFPADKCNFIKLNGEQSVYDVLVMCATKVGISQSSFPFFVLASNDNFPILPYKKKLPKVGGPFTFRIIDIDVPVEELVELDPHCLSYLYHQAVSDIKIKTELKKQNKFEGTCSLIALQMAKFSKEVDHIESIDEIFDMYVKVFDASPLLDDQKVIVVIKDRLKDYVKLKTELCCVKEYLKLFLSGFQSDVDPIVKKFGIRLLLSKNLHADLIVLSKDKFTLHNSGIVSKVFNYSSINRVLQSKDQLIVDMLQEDQLRIGTIGDNKRLKSLLCLFDFYSRLYDNTKLAINLSEVSKKIDPNALKFVKSAAYNIISQSPLTSYYSDHLEAEKVLNKLSNGWFMITWQEQYKIFCLSYARQGTAGENNKKTLDVNDHGCWYIRDGNTDSFLDLPTLINKILIPAPNGNRFQLALCLTDLLLLDMSSDKGEISYEIPELLIKMDPVPVSINWVSRSYHGSFKTITKMSTTEMKCFEYPMSGLQTKTRESYKQTLKQLISLSHINVLQVIGFSQRLGGEIFRCITEDWSDGTTLQDYLPESDPSTNYLLSIGRQLGSVLIYLHNKKIYHGCPCPSFIHLNTNIMTIKLAEIGVVDNVMIHHSGDINPYCSPSLISSECCLLRWMPQLYIRFPEVEENREKADRWCYGCTLWQIFNKGALPMANVSNKELMDLYKKIKSSSVRVEWFKTELTMPKQEKRINKKLQKIINYLLDPSFKPDEDLEMVIELYNTISEDDDVPLPEHVDIRVQKFDHTLKWTEPKSSAFMTKPAESTPQFRPNNFDASFFSFGQSGGGGTSSYTLANPQSPYQGTNQLSAEKPLQTANIEPIMNIGLGDGYASFDRDSFMCEDEPLDIASMSLLCPGNEFEDIRRAPQRQEQQFSNMYSRDTMIVQQATPANLVCDDIDNSYDNGGGENMNMWHAQYASEFSIISSSELEVGNEIGKGHFGVVKKASLITENEEREEVAVKVFDLGVIATNKTMQEDIKKEATAMKNLKHDNIVKLIGICDDVENEIWLIMPLYSLGSLAKYLKDNRHMIETKRLSSFGSQIANGMKYLVEEGFVHRDLALRNILVQNRTKVRIADLGLSRKVSKDYYYITKNKKIDIPFMCYPPEYFKTQKYDKSCDVWSYGIMCWEMFAWGKTPYSDQGIRDIPALEKFLAKQRLEPPEGTPPAYKTVLVKCWLPKASRWNFQQIATYISDSLLPESVFRVQYASLPRREETITTAINSAEQTVEFGNIQTKILHPADISELYKTHPVIPCSLFPPLQQVAVRARRLRAPCQNLRELMESEEGELFQLQHSNLTQILGVLIDADSLVLLTPAYSLGTLDQYCRHNPDVTKSYRVRTEYGKQIASGMNYLTHNKVTHSECRLSTVYVRNADTVVISDYGLDGLCEAEVYPPSYPPEVLKLLMDEQELNFNLESVVWSYGVLLWELFSLQTPYQHILHLTEVDDLAIAHHIYSFLRESRLPVDVEWPDCIRKILNSAWTDRDSRPSFEQILKDYRTSDE